jgi:hypothetical protein
VIVSDPATNRELVKISLSKEDSAVNVFKTSGSASIEIRIKRAREFEGSMGASALRSIVISEIR